MKTITTSMLLCLSLAAAAETMDPPELEWFRLHGYGCHFSDVHQTSDGDFIVAGRDHGPGRNCYGPEKSVFLFSDTGTFIWDYGVSGLLQDANWVEETSDGGFIAAGKSLSSSDLLLTKIDAEGNEEWYQVYELTFETSYAYCVLPLPNDGYAVSGGRHLTGSGGQAWVLRTDANGDTLWTRQWGWTETDRAWRVLSVDGNLTVLIQGQLESTPEGPHLVHYSLDGDLIWETDIPDLADEPGIDMYYTPSNRCYTLLTSSSPILADVTPEGEVLWSVDLPVYKNTEGLSVSGTMDGGSVIGGKAWSTSDYMGLIYKYDDTGNLQWCIQVTQSGCYEITSVRQLSQGGYIACGTTLSGKGILLRFAPETSIEAPDESPVVLLHDPEPNPSTSSFDITYELPSTQCIDLTVYDLSGRQGETLVTGEVGAGSHRTVWDPGFAPSGCYLVVLRTEEETLTQTCVLIK